MNNNDISSNDLYLPTIEEIRDQVLEDIKLSTVEWGLNQDPNIKRGSDNYIFASAFANTLALSQSNASIRSESNNAISAIGPDLDLIRINLGLPEVPGSGSSGKIKLTIQGTANVVNSTPLVSDSGIRFETVGNYMGLTNNAEISIRCLDIGDDTNLEGNTELTFLNAPINVSPTALVSIHEPLSGGVDDENDARKRLRILNKLRNTPMGFNRGAVRQIALEASPAVQNCFIYSSLGGPSTALVCVSTGFNKDIYDYSREASTNLLNEVRAKLQSLAPVETEIIIRSVLDEPTDVCVGLLLDNYASNQGWKNETIFPNNGVCSIASFVDVNKVTLSHSSTTTPIIGVTKVLWFSRNTKKFYEYIITGWNSRTDEITVDRPIIDDLGLIPTVGDYISPSFWGYENVVETLLNSFEGLGCSEMTTNMTLLPRSYRWPYQSKEYFNDLRYSFLVELKNKNQQIQDVSYIYRSKTNPSIPLSIQGRPGVLTLRNLSFMPI